jgi:hypothetical protein
MKNLAIFRDDGRTGRDERINELVPIAASPALPALITAAGRRYTSLDFHAPELT